MPKSILAAIDLGASTDQVVAAGKEYAKAFSGKLYLVHVTPKPEPIVSFPAESPGELDYGASPVVIPLDRDAAAERLHGERRALQDLGRELSDDGIDVTALSIEGPTLEKLLQEIDRLSIDLVIIGLHEPGFLHDLIFGSTMKEIMREAHCPVLVLPSPSE